MNWRSPEKYFWRPFLFRRTLAPVLGPWPWAFLSLASGGSVLGKAVLGLNLGFFFVSLALASSRRVARIWKRGGAILKEWEVCKRPWLEFSLILNQFHTVCPKIETKFLGNLGNSKVFFRPKLGGLQKKKGLHRNWEWFFARNPKFKGFSAQNQVVSKKKKKGLHRNWEWFLARIPKFKGFFRAKLGGLQKKKRSSRN